MPMNLVTHVQAATSWSRRLMSHATKTTGLKRLPITGQHSCFVPCWSQSGRQGDVYSRYSPFNGHNYT